MKTLIAFLALLCFWSPITVTSAEQNEVYYAKIMESGVTFYSSTDEGSGLFYLPQSYFVEIFDKDAGFYHVRYMGQTGYVKMGSVVPMNGVPEQPYPNANIFVRATKGVDLMDSPHLSGSVLESLPHLASEITFYGSIKGDGVPSNSNDWYYCMYNDKHGYLYGGDCNLSLATNTEIFPEITGSLFTPISPSKGLSRTAKTFIILGVSLPCALIIFLLIKPSLSGQSIKTKVKRPKRRRGDYFEFDENDLA